MNTISKMEYSKLLLSVKDDLSAEFDKLRSREELDRIVNDLTSLVNNLRSPSIKMSADKLYSDPQVTEALHKIGRFLKKALPDCNEINDFPSMLDGEADYKSALSIIDSVSHQFSTQEQIDQKFFRLIEDKYQSFKSSEDYIRRLVLKRLQEISPEFVCEKDTNGNYAIDSTGKKKIRTDIYEQEDSGKYLISTRLLILKQFIKQFGWCEGVEHSERKSDGEDYPCMRLRYMIDKSSKSWENVAKDIEESIFDELEEITDVRFSDDTGEEQWKYFILYLTNLYIEKIGVLSPDLLCHTHIDVLGEVQKVLGDFVDEKCRHIVMKSDNSTEEMTIDEQLQKLSTECVETIHAEINTRLRQIQIAEEIKEHLGLFANLEFNYGGVIKKHGGGFTVSQPAKKRSAIIAAADNIGSAHFGSVSSNRHDLFVFAIAFEMTISNSARLPNSEDPDYYSDIRKNLFFDYYTDNIINVLIKRRGSAAQQEIVSGYGINYKNFVEVCFLYYINKKGLTPLSQFSSARKMIEGCKRSNRRKSADAFENDANVEPLKETAHYAGDFWTFVNQMSEDEFKEYILENYECDVGNNQREDQPASEHRTAEVAFDQLLKHYEKSGLSIKTQIPSADFFSDRNESVLKLFEKIDSYFEMVGKITNSYKKTDEFIDLPAEIIHNGTGQFSGEEYWNLVCMYYEKFLSDEMRKPLSVTRFDLFIVACNYILTELLHDSASESADDFDKFYNYCSSQADLLGRKGLNELLLDCGFMEVNHKSLFDIVVLYYTFRNVRMLKKD